MATKAETLQAAWHRFETDRKHLPSGTREVVEWAVSVGLLQLPDIDPVNVLAGQMASALREEIRTDAKGRRYRVNHAVRITKAGVQKTFWAEMNYAPRDHMERAFAQRREQIVGDCLQLKTDVDVYNDMNTDCGHASIQLVLDFTEDVAERMLTSA